MTSLASHFLYYVSTNNKARFVIILTLHISFPDSQIRTELKICEDVFTISKSRFSVASTIIFLKIFLVVLLLMNLICEFTVLDF